MYQAFAKMRSVLSATPRTRFQDNYYRSARHPSAEENFNDGGWYGRGGRFLQLFEFFSLSNNRP